MKKKITYNEKYLWKYAEIGYPLKPSKRLAKQIKKLYIDGDYTMRSMVYQLTNGKCDNQILADCLIKSCEKHYSGWPLEV